MTQHVRTSYRKHRKATWAAVLLVAIVGALVATVIPATGAPGDPTGLKSDPLGVQPVEDPSGGSTFTCPSGFRQFQINNPKSGTYSTTVNNIPVSFTLAVSTGGPTTKDKYLSFRSNIAAVGIVAIKGGTKNAVYTYSNGPVLADGYGSGSTNPLTVDVDGSNGMIGLHAPVDSSGSPFSASYTTFCFNLPTVHPSCTAPFSGIGFAGTGGTATYSVQLVANGGCKSDDMIMYSYTPGTNKLFAVLSPISPGAHYESVEHIQWDGITLDTQNPITLWYDDTVPYDGADKVTLIPCNSDPRTDPESFTLPGSAPHSTLMPSGHTSCMLQSTDSAGSGPDNRSYDAWIFSTVDGGRGMG
jgi:hypothetical protein